MDEWGVAHHRPKPDGLYYSVVRSPVADAFVTHDDIRDYRWPNMGDRARIAGLREHAFAYRTQGKAVMVKGVLAGVFEMAQRIHGMEDGCSSGD